MRRIGVKRMIFVTADSNRARLEQLTKLLVRTFPGSTIYQHADPFRAPPDALNNPVHAVFLEAEMETATGLSIMQMLHRQKPELPVYILSESDALREPLLAAGASGYLLRPLSTQALLEALPSQTL